MVCNITQMRVVVVGAGVVGTACASALARAGAEVIVLDRGPVGAGTTSRGEGNILLSDKGPGAELELAQLSRRLWVEVGEELGADRIELEAKGGLVVATSDEAAGPLLDFAAGQRAAGVQADPTDDPRALEPFLTEAVTTGVHYPEDMQVQPVLAAAALLDDAVRHGAVARTGVEVVGPMLRAGTLAGVRTATGDSVPADLVVNAAGTWGATVSERLGAPIPVLPRRGFVLVTEPLPPRVRHKVYSADYVANVESSDAGLETSCVVEGTRAGTILIGASRERVGFDKTLSPAVVRALAAQAVRLFPFLAGVQLLRVYRGFRPYCPDHLPVIGPDPRLPGLIHACGHEGAGVGLAPGTARLVTEYATGARTPDPSSGPGALLPDRWVEVPA